MAGKLIIFSAPSGSGKSTIINYLLKQDLHHLGYQPGSAGNREEWCGILFPYAGRVPQSYR